MKPGEGGKHKGRWKRKVGRKGGGQVEAREAAGKHKGRWKRKGRGGFSFGREATLRRPPPPLIGKAAKPSWLRRNPAACLLAQCSVACDGRACVSVVCACACVCLPLMSECDVTCLVCVLVPACRHVHIHVCVLECKCAQVSPCMSVSVCLFVCRPACLSVRLHAHACLKFDIKYDVSVCVCVCVCVHVPVLVPECRCAYSSQHLLAPAEACPHVCAHQAPNIPIPHT